MPNSSLKKTLVVGASEKPDRYANIAVKRLVESGHPVLAHGYRKGKIGEVSIETEFPKHEDDIHTVTLYLSAKNQTDFYDKIIELNPKRVIFNPGTYNKEFEEKLKQANIDFEHACTLVMLSANTY